MSVPSMQHCFYCGAELGVYQHYPGDLECCGKTECQRELNYQIQAEQEDRQWRAREDGYSRY